MMQPGILGARIRRFVGPVSGDPIDQYMEFITYDRTFYPAYWIEDFQDCNTAFYSIPIASPDARVLQKLAGATKLHHVESVQNKELFLRYKEFQEANADGREAMLFHGSRDGLYNIICNQGFDLGHSKDGLFGHGLYFSSTIDYSKAFAKGRPSMLVCKVWLTGTSRISDNIHVVHSDFAAYPAYVVHYS